MRSVTWNPEIYGRYADERSRPYIDLTSRIAAQAPARVADLGCGSGSLTGILGERWPDARVVGTDSSPEMVAQAPTDLPGNVTITLQDINEFDATGYDVIVSNAALQWVPNHRELIDGWAETMAPGAWIAWQVPGNFDAPSHALMRELAESSTWRDRVGGVLRGPEGVDDPAHYAARLQAHGFDVDAWETTYIHVLTGEDPVLGWVRGTGLRPVLDVLSEADSLEFEQEYSARLREAYPSTAAGTLFPFRRVFCVGRKMSD
ncbi:MULTISPECIES: trans-aconitate 2-methyltransferase [Rhodococcus]|uniref:Trans-aconitate 2-methyltransferase n=1 Tax=Nocardia globerula TaxID=1818 RepID=A0A652YI07_NOCGL|nr:MULTISPECIES: trans-aconitate 2-methyltransferase [Rhodococcus]MCE4268830.1 trans-aconitate 2-methyltransferase [Rhodococcus globerulus]MDV8069437.1 trans-aconitate 2-methyltransferase [Rhodococcus sp. IEGM 1366]NMD60363.1 trans-aconitate 2-methyltransferase [Nocardia globerula]PVX63522.1 trans-aconitate 2-methyltransferase [Rhodococcus globerulus]